MGKEELYISANPGFPGTIRDTARCIKKAGFTGLFINLNEGVVNEDDIKFIRNEGLEIDSLHLPYRNGEILINHLWENTSGVDQEIKTLCGYIRLAKKSGINTVILHSSNGYHPPRVTDDGINNFRRIAAYCNDLQMKLAIENIKRTDYVIHLLQKLDAYDVGFCFDVGHANAFTHNLYSNEWEKALKLLAYVHLHDNDGREDLHLMPGKGIIDFKRIRSMIRKSNPEIKYVFELYYKGREHVYGPMSEEKFFDDAYQAAAALFEEAIV